MATLAPVETGSERHSRLREASPDACSPSARSIRRQPRPSSRRSPALATQLRERRITTPAGRSGVYADPSPADSITNFGRRGVACSFRTGHRDRRAFRRRHWHGAPIRRGARPRHRAQVRGRPLEGPAGRQGAPHGPGQLATSTSRRRSAGDLGSSDGVGRGGARIRRHCRGSPGRDGPPRRRPVRRPADHGGRGHREVGGHEGPGRAVPLVRPASRRPPPESPGSSSPACSPAWRRSRSTRSGTAGVVLGWVDLAFPEERLAIEYEGAYHFEGAQIVRDDARFARLIAAGWRVIRLSAADLRDLDVRRRPDPRRTRAAPLGPKWPQWP